jgi:hypothetical protein
MRKIQHFKENLFEIPKETAFYFIKLKKSKQKKTENKVSLF